jgi:hypothetical protein
VIVTDPALIVRTSAVSGPVAVTVAMATSLLVHPTAVNVKEDPSAALPVARTSTESPRTTLFVSADTWMVWIDGGSGGVGSLQAVSIAAASMNARFFIIVERSVNNCAGSPSPACR